jgi:plasmid stabilization system protein ParE
MNFTVRWTRTARDQLAAVWLAHADRAGVTAAAHRIDTLLAVEPENQGEDRPNNRRVIFLAPLVVLYKVNTTTNVVTVVGVGQYGTP